MAKILASLVSALLLAAPSFCWASRVVEPGEAAPQLRLQSAAGDDIALRDYLGSPVLLVFWAAKNPVMEEHSKEVIAACSAVWQKYRSHELAAFAVRFPPHKDSTGGPGDEGSEASIPVLIAPDAALYSAWGLFILPTVVLLDAEHRVLEVIGYTRDIGPRIDGATAVMLGLRTEAEVEKELHPEPVVVTDEVKLATRHLNLGRRFLDKGRPEKALEELMKALEVDPENSSCLFAAAEALLQLDRPQEALQASDTGLGLDPDNRRGELVNAQALAATGSTEEALEILAAIEGKDRLRAEALVAIGVIYRNAGSLEEALAAYAEATEILLEMN
ncbi:MAG: tetratricopeptide repeat protein [bacterium]|nr:tetratricopeptide repeat protein [bacterium]